MEVGRERRIRLGVDMAIGRVQEEAREARRGQGARRGWMRPGEARGVR